MMERSNPKTFEQETSQLDVGDEFTAVRVKTTVYLPGLLSRDGVSTIREFLLLALASAFAKFQNSGKSIEDAKIDKDDNTVDVAITEISAMFAQAATIVAHEELMKLLEDPEGTFNSMRGVIFPANDEETKNGND